MADTKRHLPGPDFASLYRPMSDLELHALAADWHSLVDQAQAALATEFAARGILLPEAEGEPEEVAFRDLVTLRRYRDLSEAIVARGAIESAGIFCFLKDENLVRLDWQMSNMIGGIRLQVASADVAAAESVLDQPIPNSIDFQDEVLDEPDFQQPRCPRCNSSDISYERNNRKGALVALYLFALPVPRGDPSWTCNQCGHHWVDDREES